MSDTPRIVVAATVAVLLACGTAGGRGPGGKESSMSEPLAASNPKYRYRIDAFQVPDAARPEFEAAMERTLEFLRTLPGFRGHRVLARSSGPSRFDLVTIATWESEEAADQAGKEVRAYYARIGFDPAAAMARWGVKGELGFFRDLEPTRAHPSP
jgi:heme-degrading monooxygenase HmoA